MELKCQEVLLAKLECGTPDTPPCNVERQISSSSAPGVKDGVSGTYTTTNFQTDSKIEGKPGTETLLGKSL